MDRRLRSRLIGAAALGAVLAAVPFLLPAAVYRDRIEQAVTRATGRNFTIAGALHFTMFPMLGIRAEHVALANPPGFREPDFARAEDLRLGVRFLPLLAGRIEVSRIVLERPRIDLEVDASGRADWTFDRARSKPANSSANHRGVAAPVMGLRIEDGSVTYINARSRHSNAIDKLDATIAAGDLDSAASMSGSFLYRGGLVGFAARVSASRAVLADKAANIDLSLRSNLLTAGFVGVVAPDGALLGRLNIRSPSVRRAGDWLGAKLPRGGGLESFSLDCAIKGDNRLAKLSDIRLVLDGAMIAGDLSLDARRETPAVRGILRADRLDLDPYTEAPRGNGAARPKHAEEWSREPIALDVLRRFDADLTLETASLHLRDLTLGKTRIEILLADGALRARAGPMTLYGGSGRAELSVDARAPMPAFRNTVEFDNVALKPFLSDTIGVRQIEGTGTIKLDAASRGLSADALMHGLNGTGSIAFRGGHLRGVDLGGVARAMRRVLNGAIGPGAFTDYSAMGGSFAIANGVLTSNDFRLAGPLIQTTGSGTVDVAGRAIDFRIVPKATAPLGGGKTLTIGVPFRIKGPWKHVQYAPDFSGIATGILDNLKAGKAPFKGLFGGSDPNAPKKKHKSIGDALKNMLGVH